MTDQKGGSPPENAVFPFSEGQELKVTSAMKESYNTNGYVLIKGLLSSKELEKVNHAIDTSPDIKNNAYGRDDGAGRVSMMTVWNHPGDDILGITGRMRKVVLTAQELMGGDEVYHYHTKLMMKKGKVGGAFVWHQDYGYWYNNGCMFPEMSTVFMAIDPCTRENGCLQVLRGSQRAGRIEHVTVGRQAGADLDRVSHLATLLPLDYVQMAPGDALFFHCNLLHCSSQNNSDQRRYALLTAFNKRANNPLWMHHHPQYTPLDLVPDDAVLKCERLTSSTNKWFMDPEQDTSYRGNKADGK